MSTIDEIKHYITEKFATEICSDELPSDVDLLATGILTSVSTVQLLGWCGRNYRIPINSIPINPDDLKTPEGIARFIEANRTDAVAQEEKESTAMFTRSKTDVRPVEWGNGTSHRLLTAADNMGFAVAHTLVRAGTESKLEYRQNLEACYCIRGSGNVEDTHGNRFEIIPGVIYALEGHDPHYLRASENEDLELVSIFNPPIRGDEQHTLNPSGFSSY